MENPAPPRQGRTRLWIWLALVVCVAWVAWWFVGYDFWDRPAFQAAAEQSPDAVSAQAVRQEGAAQTPGSPTPASKPLLTDAERLAKLTRAMEADRKRLADLKHRLEDPLGDFALAGSEFRTIDEELAAKEKRVKTLEAENKANEAAALRDQLKPLREQWQIARDRLNLAIQEQRILKDKCAALEEKLEQDQRLLDQMTGKMAAAPPAPHKPAQPAEPQAAGGRPANPEAKAESAPKDTKPAAKEAALAAANPALGVAAAAGPGEGGGKAATALDKARAKEVRDAEARAKVRHQAADEAAKQLEAVKARVLTIQKYVEIERGLVETARQKAEQARAAVQKFEGELQRRLAEDPTGIEELEAKIAESRRRAETAETDLKLSQDRQQELQGYLEILRGQQATLARDAARKRQEADAADAAVLDLENPYTVRNLLQWLLDHGPRVLLVVGLMLTLYRLIAVGSRRLVAFMTASTKRGTQEERENRAHTLASVFHNAATIAVIGGGGVMLLDTLGVPIVPLMGGAAVVGLAVAFGAQNLIRDYFAGFMVLLENQYGINDVVKIGETAGKVERITLRMTVLRDAQGVVHFIPHGNITRVSNMTHGYSVALFEIGVSYKEDVDHVMRVLLDLAKDLRRDPTFGPRILEDPEMQGVDNFTDSAVVLRFSLKTRPMHQWAVRRELLRRIKNRFDQLGIEIPFPHRTVYHRTEGGATPTAEQIATSEGLSQVA